MKVLKKEEYLKLFQPKVFLKTGLYPIDFELFSSGIPSSRAIILSGEPGSGKSTFIIHLLKKLYRQGYEIMILDTEGAFSFGFDDFDFKALDIECVEDLFEFFLNTDMNKKVFVWDTITNTPTRKILKGEDVGIAELPRVLSLFFKMITKKILISDCFFIGVLEKREQIQPFKPLIDSMFSGVGNTIKAVPSVLLYFNASKEDVENSIFKVSVMAIKNRFGKTFQKVEVFMKGGVGYLEDYTLINYLISKSVRVGKSFVLEESILNSIREKIGDFEIVGTEIYLDSKNQVVEVDMSSDENLLVPVDEMKEKRGYKYSRQELEKQAEIILEKYLAEERQKEIRESSEEKEKKKKGRKKQNE